MANLLSRLGLSIIHGWTQICAVHGEVSLPDEGDGAGQLQLRYQEGSNLYCIYAFKTAGGGKSVCELLILMFYSFTSKSALKKSKRYINKEVQISFRPILSKWYHVLRLKGKN